MRTDPPGRITERDAGANAWAVPGGRGLTAEDITPDAGARSSAGGGVRRVIVIEDCSGVQVGRENEQYSVYRVTLPELEIGSADRLAEALLGEDLPSVGDRFSHDAPRFRVNGPSGGRGSGARRISAEAEGDTMVLVRDCRGVQVGDRNVQRNQFRVRAGSVEIEAGDLALSAERAGLVARLQQDPGDRAAARKLAANIAEAAATDLEVTLASEVVGAMGSPQIEGWPGTVRDRTGVQIGADSEATAEVEARVLKWKAAVLELTRHLLDAAARLEASRSAEIGDVERRREATPEAEAELEAEI